MDRGVRRVTAALPPWGWLAVLCLALGYKFFADVSWAFMPMLLTSFAVLIGIPCFLWQLWRELRRPEPRRALKDDSHPLRLIFVTSGVFLALMIVVKAMMQ